MNWFRVFTSGILTLISLTGLAASGEAQEIIPGADGGSGSEVAESRVGTAEECSVSAHRPEQAVTGTVTTDTGDPLPGARLALECDAFRRGARVNPDGSYTLHVPPGAYRLRVEREGYIALDRVVTVDDEEETRWDLSLPPVTFEDSVTVTDTAGTDSYAGGQVTVGSKLPTSLREMPQSVSVITRQQIEDRNFTKLSEALKYTAGAFSSDNDYSGNRHSIQLRGYSAGTYQVDGLRLEDDVGGRGTSTFDLALYERAEVLRGPAGLFMGSGSPGGMANLVRKRATDTRLVSGAASYGSWEHARFETDISGPLSESGELRGRVVAVYDDRQSFVDVVESEKQTLYGIVERDLTDRTTLALGGTHQRVDSVNERGLPAYADGRLLDVPRSRHGGFDWNNHDYDNSEIFADLEHRSDSGLEINVSGRYFEQDSALNAAYADSTVDPATGDYELRIDRQDVVADAQNFDANVVRPFRMRGLQHSLVVGADYAERTNTSRRGRAFAASNIFSTDYSTFPEPDLPYNNSQRESTTREYGAYSQLRLKPMVESTTVVMGARVSWWDTLTEDLPTGEVTSDEDVAEELTPYLAVVQELNEQLSLYASYAEIFDPQTNLMVDGSLVPPRIGGQYELGINGELLHGALLGHLAVFRIRDENRAIEDPENVDFSIPGGLQESRGVEVEVSGRPLPGLNLIASYAYTTTEVLRSDDPEEVGDPFDSTTPEHIFSLWANYSFPEGRWSRWSVGGGVKAVSDYYSEDDGVVWEQGEYAVFDARIGYRINESIDASLSARNLLDEVYYASLSGGSRHNYYGAPRSVTLSVRTRF